MCRTGYKPNVTHSLLQNVWYICCGICVFVFTSKFFQWRNTHMQEYTVTLQPCCHHWHTNFELYKYYLCITSTFYKWKCILSAVLWYVSVWSSAMLIQSNKMYLNMLVWWLLVSCEEMCLQDLWRHILLFIV